MHPPPAGLGIPPHDQEALSSYGAWYLVIVGGPAVAATLVSSRGLWGFAAERFGWSLLPVGYRVRPPRG